MGGKKKKGVGGRVLRFAVSGALVVGSAGAAACDEDTTGNEIPPETFETVNEPDPNGVVPAPDPNELAPDPTEIHTNEPAPEGEATPPEPDDPSGGSGANEIRMEEPPRVNSPRPE